MWKKRHHNSKAGINNRSDITTDLPILALKNSAPLENSPFLNIFYLGGRRGFRWKKLEILEPMI
jgi:hypothetical protein